MSTVKFRKVPELFPNRKVRTVRTEQLWTEKQTKVSTKFRRETNPSEYHRQVPEAGPIFFQWQGIWPARTWRSAATGNREFEQMYTHLTKAHSWL